MNPSEFVFFSLQIIASFIYLFFCLWDNNNYNARPDGGIVIKKKKKAK